MDDAAGSRPRASLGRLIDDLGATFLDVAHGDAGTQHIGGVAIHDPLDPPVLPPSALVLGVGVDTADQVVALLGALGREHAAALVLRAPVPLTAEVRAAADDAGVAVLGLSRGASWAQLSEMLRALLLSGDSASTGEPDSLGGLPSGDLFAVANAISALLDAPVTIEDRSSRVLAFSGRQDEADPSRVETILGRQVPEHYARVLQERGVFRDLHRSDEPVHIDPLPGLDGTLTLPRVAVAVRAGDEVLGSIWAVVTEPLSRERLDALGESAKLVALHLLRVRAGADARRGLRADLLASALAGGTGALESLERLGLGGRPLLVLGVTLDESTRHTDPDDASLTHERQRLSDAFALHLAAVHPRSAAAALGGVTYGLLSVSGPVEEAEARAVRVVRDFIDRVGDRMRPVAAVGGVAADFSGVARSRTDVDRALRVLCNGGGDRRVGRLDELQGEALVLELQDLAVARGDEPTGALARLVAYDARHQGALVGTLRAWLDHFGDVGAAADSVFVHANTFRYRLRRASEVGELDLGDPDQRFALMLQLRVLRLEAPLG
ncbi:helix-turn-helix domain-containing protein [Alloalcanivorax gelatiniphagus]